MNVLSRQSPCFPLLPWSVVIKRQDEVTNPMRRKKQKSRGRRIAPVVETIHGTKLASACLSALPCITLSFKLDADTAIGGERWHTQKNREIRTSKKEKEKRNDGVPSCRLLWVLSLIASVFSWSQATKSNQREEISSERRGNKGVKKKKDPDDLQPKRAPGHHQDIFCWPYSVLLSYTFFSLYTAPSPVPLVSFSFFFGFIFLHPYSSFTA